MRPAKERRGSRTQEIRRVRIHRILIWELRQGRGENETMVSNWVTGGDKGASLSREEGPGSFSSLRHTQVEMLRKQIDTREA